MSNLVSLLHESAVITATTAGIYTVTVSIAALAALLARSGSQRRDAREVLKILLRRRRG